MSALGDAAVGYAERGWYVFPLRPRTKVPLYGGGFKRATADPDRVREMWRQHPTANIGLYPGRSGLIVINIDGPKGETEATTLGLLDWETLMVSTPGGGGGLHLYFNRPEFLVIPNRCLVEGIDVRGDRGYVVVPPSIHPNGGTYEWINPSAITLCLSDRELSLLKDRLSSDESARAARDSSAAAAVREGTRYNHLAAYAKNLFARGMSDAEALILVRARNAKHCAPPLAVQEVDRLVFDIGKHAQTNRRGSEPRATELDVIGILIVVGAMLKGGD